MEKKYIYGIVAVIVILVLIIIILYVRSGSEEEPQHVVLNEKKSPVKNIKVENVNGETKVSWQPVEGATHYTMYYSETKNFDKTKVNTHNPIEDNSMTLGSDVPRGYYFRVSATRNVNGKLIESPLSSEHYMFLDAVQ